MFSQEAMAAATEVIVQKKYYCFFISIFLCSKKGYKPGGFGGLGGYGSYPGYGGLGGLGGYGG